MSGVDDRGGRVAPNIYPTRLGKFEVRILCGGKKLQARFDSLDEATAWRDDVIARRPKRKYERAGQRLETPLDRRLREELESAPRKRVRRDGRTFTLVKLPGYELPKRRQG